MKFFHKLFKLLKTAKTKLINNLKGLKNFLKFKLGIINFDPSNAFHVKINAPDFDFNNFFHSTKQGYIIYMDKEPYNILKFEIRRPDSLNDSDPTSESEEN